MIEGYYGGPPSVKRLKELLHIDNDKANKIRHIIRYGYEHAVVKFGPEAFPKTEDYIRRCHGFPKNFECMMQALDELTDGFGIEVIRRDGKVVIEYVNTGESYATTILFNHDTWTFQIKSWGDLVERGRYD